MAKADEARLLRCLPRLDATAHQLSRQEGEVVLGGEGVDVGHGEVERREVGR